MQATTHLIPIVASFEIIPSPAYRPVLDKDAATELASALADDLARQLPDSAESFLVVGAVVTEPNQLLRPGFAMWQALDQLSKPILRDQGLHSGLLAIGAHQGQMPDDRLQPTQYTLMGQFVCLPMLLVVDASQAEEIESHLEARLFEFGSIHPPARALLAKHAGLDSVHGQLLTRHDLLALQRVQLDSAGLSGFWDVLEAVLLAPEQDHRLTLPAELEVSWSPKDSQLSIDFLTVKQWAQRHGDETLAGYRHWCRAYRTLLAMAQSHGLSWSLTLGPDVVLDDQRNAIIEVHAIDSSDTVKRHLLTEHWDEQLGLVAWTLIEDERMIHIYPVAPEAMTALQKDFHDRGFFESARINGLCYNEATQQLMAAPISP